jgi:hypothetical protein
MGPLPVELNALVTQIAQDLQIRQSGFLADLADSGLPRRFTWLDVALRQPDLRPSLGTQALTPQQHQHLFAV